MEPARFRPRKSPPIILTENEDDDVWDGRGYDLHLDENEFVFLFEITHHPQQFNDNPTLDPDLTADEYWQEAHDRDGDPNFNDVLVHVEIDPPEETADFGFDGVVRDEDGSAISVGPGNSDDDENGDGDDGPDIDVGSDEIVIG